MSDTIMDYSDFSRTLNRIVFGNSKQDLLEKIAKYPQRYVGLFRPTRPETKIIQNILQSHEIRFGDALEIIFEKYFIIKGFKILPKEIKNGGVVMSLDQFIEKGGNYYLIEQKVRDDHDSSKKRGQIDNFEKKIEILTKEYNQSNIHCYFYFVDPDLSKNKRFYEQELNSIYKDYRVECKLCYGKELFDNLKLEDVWNEVLKYLKTWKKSLPTIPEINFDKNSNESFDVIKKISPSVYRKLFNNPTIIEELFPIIFPNKKTLNLLKEHFENKYNASKLHIYKTLSESIGNINYKVE